MGKLFLLLPVSCDRNSKIGKNATGPGRRPGYKPVDEVHSDCGESSLLLAAGSCQHR